jgi:serine/threonine-protein kinase
VAEPTTEQQRLALAVRGQYAIVRELGRGGMGIVFLARDLRLDRDVAIKTLPAHLAADSGVRERFLREARTAAALSHPNIVPIHRADEVDGLVFFVMGYVDGASAAQLVRAGPLSPRHAVALLSDVATALSYAHGRGVIHRDIKAENILLDRTDDRALVTDFGIARLAESAPMTATGQVLGTVFYMSPEQVSGEPLDGRSDLYSLGVLGFYLLSGRFPFEHESPSAVLVAHVTRRAPPLRSVAPGVHAALASIVDRLLEKRASDRFASANEVAQVLTRLPGDATSEIAPRRELLSQTEAQAVWERAALLQEMTGSVAPPNERARRSTVPASATSGYALDAVREAASEAGIASRYVERALAERTNSTDSGSLRQGAAMIEPVSALLGSRTRLEYEITLDGEVPLSAVEDVADALRRGVGEIGNLSVVGRSLSFTSSGGPQPQGSGTYPRRLEVTVTSRNGRTLIRGFEDLRQFAQGMFWGVTGGVGGGVGGMSFGVVMGLTKGLVLLAAPVGLGVAALACVGARFGLRYSVRKRDAALQATLRRVADRVRELIQRPAAIAAGDHPRLPR